MDKLLKKIDKQIESNQGKNIFLDATGFSLSFIQDTIKAISELSDLKTDDENVLIDYATDKSLQEFCRTNQYYSFNSQAKSELRLIYVDLFLNIRKRIDSTDKISRHHYQCLKQWLQKTNGFAERIYTNETLKIEPVVCSEYSPDLQARILHIDRTKLMEPVLDIGCGKQGNLVNLLRKNGIEAYGFDRVSFSVPHLLTADWLEYYYGIEKWGTILSNLGFSNHFAHHHLRDDGNYIEYGKTYLYILNSLKIGGCFHYAPSLPFIEPYVDINHYELSIYRFEAYNVDISIIKRSR